ncbi:hypothetical protein IV102_13485 [bacterium]|nr:hypothetical protein [bacterium]
MSDSLVTIDSFLGQLTREGSLDSTGTFTLSLEHAKKKLFEFLLASREEYLLKLVQAGVAAGAESMEMRSGGARVAFIMRGVSFQAADLKHVLDHLLQPSSGPQQRALSHLAIAINSAVDTRATGISLATWDGQSGQKIAWSSAGRTHKSWRPLRKNLPLLHLEVQRTPLESLGQFMHLIGQRDILSMLVGSRAGLDPDCLLLMERALWCPVPLALNGRWLPKPNLPLPDEGGDPSWRPRTPQDPGIRRFKPGSVTWPWTRSFLAPGEAVYTRTGDHQLMWIYDGVLVRTEVLRWPLGWGVSSAYGCNTDLTGLSLVEDEALQRKRQDILDYTTGLY